MKKINAAFNFKNVENKSEAIFYLALGLYGAKMTADFSAASRYNLHNQKFMEV